MFLFHLLKYLPLLQQTMKAQVINLRERSDRWESIQRAWRNVLDVERTDAIRMENGYHAVFLKHREMLQQAKERGDTHLLILEDDAVPCDEFQTRWSQLKAYLDSREDWDIFNGGMLSMREGVEKITRIKQDGMTTMLLNVREGCMAQFLYFRISDTLFDGLQKWEEEGKPEFDGWYPRQFRVVACIPYLAIQEDGFSDVGAVVREWRERFKVEEIMMKYALRDFWNAPG